MTPHVLYFHGFASSPNSAKVRAVRALLGGSAELNTPDINVPSFEQLDFEQMVALGVREGSRKSPQAIVGSSLGALVALEVVRRGVAAPLVLIAPALGIGRRWLDELPAGDPIEVFNHARGTQAPIHRRFFEQMAEVTADSDAPGVPVVVIMGERDETVPYDFVIDTWKRWEASGRLRPRSKFISIPGGDHSLIAHVDVIAAEILTAAGVVDR